MRVDLLLGPEIRLEVLDPLEVGDGYPAGVREDVGNDRDPPVGEDRIRLGCGRTVRSFHHDPGLDPPRVLAGDLPLDRGGDQHVARELEEFRGGDRLGARVAGQGPRGAQVLQDGPRVQPVGVVGPPVDVAHRHDLAPLLVQEAGRRLPDVAEPLDGHPAAGKRDAPQARGLPGDDHDPSAGGVAPPHRASDHDGLARDHGRHRIAPMHAVGVHDPGHDLGVGPDVGRGDIALGAHEGAHLARVPPGQPLQFVARELSRVARDAAFGAPEGKMHERRLPGHPHRERPNLVEPHLRAVADPSLGRAEHRAVVDPVSREEADRAVVHRDREMYDEFAVRSGQVFADAALEREMVGGGLELVHRHLPRILSRHRCCLFRNSGGSSSQRRAADREVGGRSRRRLRTVLPRPPDRRAGREGGGPR